MTKAMAEFPVRAEWMYEVRSACQMLQCRVWQADRPQFEDALGWLPEAVPSAISSQETETLKDFLRIGAVEAARVFHKAYHEQHLHRQCPASPLEAVLDVWADHHADPRVVFKRWTKAFLSAFDETHPLSPTERAAAILRDRFRNPPTLGRACNRNGLVPQRANPRIQATLRDLVWRVLNQSPPQVVHRRIAQAPPKRRATRRRGGLQPLSQPSRRAAPRNRPDNWQGASASTQWRARPLRAEARAATSQFRNSPLIFRTLVSLTAVHAADKPPYPDAFAIPSNTSALGRSRKIPPRLRRPPTNAGTRSNGGAKRLRQPASRLPTAPYKSRHEPTIGCSGTTRLSILAEADSLASDAGECLQEVERIETCGTGTIPGTASAIGTMRGTATSVDAAARVIAGGLKNTTRVTCSRRTSTCPAAASVGRSVSATASTRSTAPKAARWRPWARSASLPKAISTTSETTRRAPDEALKHLENEGLIRTSPLSSDDRAVTLTDHGRDLLVANRLRPS